MAVPEDRELAQLSARFVRVRLIQMGGVDLATFQFDPLLSWATFFMNADKTIYGRFGRAHPQTKRDRKDSNPNHTLDGLKAAMRRALEIHDGYTKDPGHWSMALAGKTGPEPRWRFTEKNPAARKYKRLRRIAPDEEKGCVHCHEVQRTAIDSYFMKKIELPDKMLWMYPRPHVLGLRFDNGHRARVTDVAAGSFADKAGVKPGDDLLTLGGQPLLSIADVQWVLHNFPDKGGPLHAEVRRGDESLPLKMELAPDWRRAEDFVWRYRVAGYSSWLWAGVGFKDDARGVRVDHRAPRWFKKANPDGKRKLAPGDIIVKVDGRTGLDRSALLAYLMREKRLGSQVRLEVLRRGAETDVTFRIPKKQPEVQGH